ncbi:MAG: DUF4190 domain-containing protein [Planctomycetota bacterium]|nr:DUF4190 domain-containing protein [Planctomycetota bacterium]
MSGPEPTLRDAQLCCRFCGYNLTGTLMGGVCPECGRPVADTIRTFAEAKTSGKAIASLVLGIISLTTGCLLLGPLAIYYAKKSEAETAAGTVSRSSKGIAKAGFVLGVISTVLMLGYVVLLLAGLAID